MLLSSMLSEFRLRIMTYSVKIKLLLPKTGCEYSHKTTKSNRQISIIANYLVLTRMYKKSPFEGVWTVFCYLDAFCLLFFFSQRYSLRL